jgi:hypothetical protein
VYKKAIKYYYGIWDKLCQKTQTAWNQEIVERVWMVVQKLWVNINSRIPKYIIEIKQEISDDIDDMIILFRRFLNEDINKNGNFHHSIFNN